MRARPPSDFTVEMLQRPAREGAERLRFGSPVDKRVLFSIYENLQERMPADEFAALCQENKVRLDQYEVVPA